MPRQVLNTRRRHRHRRRPRDTRQETVHCKVLGSFHLIHERSTEADVRVEFGHWEGGPIIGQRYASALITLTERVSRAQVVLDLPHGYEAHHVRKRLIRLSAATPKENQTFTGNKVHRIGATRSHFPMRLCDRAAIKPRCKLWPCSPT